MHNKTVVKHVAWKAYDYSMKKMSQRRSRNQTEINAGIRWQKKIEKYSFHMCAIELK